MAQKNRREVKVRPVRKNKPDVRALARVLVELAMAEPDVVDAEAEQPA